MRDIHHVCVFTITIEVCRIFYY